MNKVSKELEFFEIENRLREIVSGLLEPVMKKSEENEANLKNLLAAAKMNEDTMKNFEALLSGSIVRMVTNEDFNKKLMEIYSDKRSSDTVFHMKIESIGSRVDFMNHQFTDMNSRIRNLEEIGKHVRMGFDDVTSSLREFKEQYSLRLEKVELAQLDSNDSKSDYIEALDQSIRLHSSLIDDINQNVIPEILNKVEFQQKDLKDLNSKFSPLLEDRVIPSDLKKLKNQFDYEAKKNVTHQTSQVNNLREYLDKMLRIEINCGISDTLLQVLDPRQIKKLIPVAETQLLTKEDEGVQVSPGLDVAVLSTEDLSKKTEEQHRKIEHKLTQAKRKLTKDLEKPVKSPTIKKLEISQIDSALKSPVLSGQSTSKREPEPIIIKNPLNPKDSKLSPLRANSSDSDNLKRPKTKRRVDTIMSSLMTEKSESFEQISEISLDPIWVQEQINTLTVEMKISQQTREEVLNLMNVCIEAMKLKVVEAQEEFSKTIMILNEEVIQLSKQRQKDLSDVYSYIGSNIAEINEKIVKLDNNDSKIVKMNETLLGVIENEKIIFELVAQDEADRKNIQLLGYSENKNSKLPKSKAVISLKPECLSCTGENPLVYSVFKMACLSYSPSDVRYNSRVYTRSELIEKLGELVKGVWTSGEVGIKSRAIFSNDFSGIRVKSHQRNRTTSKNFFELNKMLSEHVTPQHSRRDIKYSMLK